MKKRKKSQTKNQQLTRRQEIFVALLPKHNWIIYKTGIAAGFTHYYAKNRLPAIVCSNVVLREAVAGKKAEIAKEAKIEAKDILDAFLDLAQRCKEKHPAVAVRCLENIAKHVGFYAEDNLQKQDGIPGLTREEWEQLEKVEERMRTLSERIELGADCKGAR